MPSEEIIYLSNDARKDGLDVYRYVVGRIQFDQPGIRNRCRQSAPFIERRNSVPAAMDYKGWGFHLVKDAAHVNLRIHLEDPGCDSRLRCNAHHLVE